MSSIRIRGAIVLACVILVSTLGACQTSGSFNSFTSMFTAVALPSYSHAQVADLGNSDFIWRSLGSMPSSQSGDVSTLKNGLTLSLTTPTTTSSSIWTSTPLAMGINENDNPGMASYKNFLKRYMNDSANIYEN